MNKNFKKALIVLGTIAITIIIATCVMVLGCYAIQLSLQVNSTFLRVMITIGMIIIIFAGILFVSNRMLKLSRKLRRM